MGYYDDEKKVEDYIKMAEGIDGRALVEVLKKHLEKGASVLELGMGPGKDFEILAEDYQVTGSDNSQVFLERYRQRDTAADLVLLDALTMEIGRKFDCIYSNKVLHHLTKAELRASFEAQRKVLKGHGLLFHSFWYGDGEEEFSGLRFVYYTEDSLAGMIGPHFEIVEAGRYSELEENDSIYFALKKNEGMKE